MIRPVLFLPLALAACAGGPRPPPPQADIRPIVTAGTPVVRPVVAGDSLQGRWTIIAVNGRKTHGLWLDLGAEGLGTVTRTGNAILVGLPQPHTRAYLGCNQWHPNGWTRNGDKLTLGTEMAVRTERGCDPDRMAVDDQSYAVLSIAMTMEFTPPSRLRLINEKGTIDLVREGRGGVRAAQ